MIILFYYYHLFLFYFCFFFCSWKPITLNTQLEKEPGKQLGILRGSSLGQQSSTRWRISVTVANRSTKLDTAVSSLVTSYVSYVFFHSISFQTFFVSLLSIPNLLCPELINLHNHWPWNVLKEPVTTSAQVWLSGQNHFSLCKWGSIVTVTRLHMYIYTYMRWPISSDMERFLNLEMNKSLLLGKLAQRKCTLGYIVNGENRL